jgi:hypothetical protein
MVDRRAIGIASGTEVSRRAGSRLLLRADHTASELHRFSGFCKPW